MRRPVRLLAFIGAFALVACGDTAAGADEPNFPTRDAPNGLTVDTFYIETPDRGDVLCAAFRQTSEGVIAVSCDWPGGPR